MRILTVDDSPIVRRILRKELTRGGYEVVEATNGEEGLAHFLELRPDLVTLNVEMADVHGFKVCERIREWETEQAQAGQPRTLTPVVFITANDTVADRERGFDVGGTDFLTKPFPEGKLLEVVGRILRPGHSWQNVTALVAEDSNISRKVVCNALHRLGINVLEAEDGSQALELAKQHLHRLDIVVTDYNMPFMDGEALCRELRSLDVLKEVPIIVLSAQAEKPAILRLFEAGATDYLIKPFSIEELQARITVHLTACLLTRELARHNQEMQADLELAREVQQAALHANVNVGFVKHAVHYLPHSLVSGDVYEFKTNKDGDLCVFLGDATGHGVGAAFMTMMVEIAMDSIPAEAPVEDILAHMHALIHERTGDQYVTGVYARISAQGKLTLASAGHPPVILIPRNGNARLLSDSGGLPLGMLEDALPFVPTEHQLAAGDRLYLYTDGVSEWPNVDGEQYDIGRMMAYLKRNADKPLAKTLTGLTEDARRFAGGIPCGDDLTVLVIEMV